MKRIIYIIGLVLAVPFLSACSFQGGTNQPLDTKFSEIEKQEWQYVVLGGVANEWYPEILAEKIEQNLNVTVEIIYWRDEHGFSSSTELLEDIETNESLREIIANAELITFYTPLERLYSVNLDPVPPQCGGDDNQDCLRKAIETYKQDVEDFVSELVSLVDIDSTVVLAHTSWPFFTYPRGSGLYDTLTGYYEEANSHLNSVCEKFGIPVADVYIAFMGADGSKNPVEDDLVEDVWGSYFPTPDGNEVIANLLYELGR